MKFFNSWKVLILFLIFKQFKILRITPYHLDSLIGLGEVYLAMGEAPRESSRSADAEEMFTLAIENYTLALDYSINKTDKASKKLRQNS